MLFFCLWLLLSPLLSPIQKTKFMMTSGVPPMIRPTGDHSPLSKPQPLSMPGHCRIPCVTRIASGSLSIGGPCASQPPESNAYFCLEHHITYYHVFELPLVVVPVAVSSSTINHRLTPRRKKNGESITRPILVQSKRKRAATMRPTPGLSPLQLRAPAKGSSSTISHHSRRNPRSLEVALTDLSYYNGRSEGPRRQGHRGYTR